MDIWDLVAKWGPFVITGVIAIGGWMIRRGLVTHDDFSAWRKAHDAEHDEIDGRLSDGQQQFTRMESDIKHLPTRDDIDGLKTQLAKVDKGVVRLEGKIGMVAVKLGAVEKDSDRLTDFHLTEDRD